MKKVLFGILVLSFTVFSANPGIPTTDGSGIETASVPVRVICDVLDAPNGLTITDETGTALQELLIDHGQIVKGNVVGDSVAFKNFRVRRYGTDGIMEFLLPDTQISGTLKISLDGITTTLYKGGDATSIPSSKLVSTLSLAGSTGDAYTVNLTVNGEKEHRGKITSTIANSEFANNDLKAGFHHNSAERTLTVVYQPGS